MTVKHPRMAYGVDPTRKEFFSLRQARYDALGEDLARLARLHHDRGERLRVLDIGPFDGVTLRHLESRDGHENVDYSIADIELWPNLYKREEYREIFIGDLMEGYPHIPSNSYDVVVCEQVLEHLTALETPIRTLARLTKPGGIVAIGVPIFPHGLHWIREHGQPTWDRWFQPGKVRGHVQSFSKRRFLSLVRRWTDLQLEEIRGFRIVSGGVLRPLEHRRWWWRLNRQVGRMVPGLCVEIQALFRRPKGPLLPIGLTILSGSAELAF